MFCNPAPLPETMPNTFPNTVPEKVPVTFAFPETRFVMRTLDAVKASAPMVDDWRAADCTLENWALLLCRLSRSRVVGMVATGKIPTTFAALSPEIPAPLPERLPETFASINEGNADGGIVPDVMADALIPEIPNPFPNRFPTTVPTTFPRIVLA